MTIFTHPTIINTSSYRRPYLNFKEKITQLLVNPYSVVLVLFIIKLYFFLTSLVNSLEQAQLQTHLMYNGLEKYASNLVSFPHYMTQASNLMIAKSLESANKGLVKTLQLMVTASESLIFFIIELSIGTYACLLTAAIDDTAIAALNATESIISVANETLVLFARDLNDGLQDLTTVINEVIGTVDDTGDALKHLFGTSSKSTNTSAIDNGIKHVNLTISNMQNWQISSSINDKIEKLKDEIPDFADVQNYTQNIIDIPFKELKRQVSTHLNKTFDATEMYVPNKTKLDFSDGKEEIDKLFSHLVSVAKTTTHVIMGIVAFLILVFLIYQFYIELKDWARILDASRHLNYANESYSSSSAKKKYNIEVIKTIQDRKSSFVGSIITEKIFRIKNPVLANNVRWVISYAASPILLPFLLLGLLGIASVVCQYIILHLINKIDFESSGSEILSKTQTEIYTSFNDSMNSWTNETNNYILNYQDDVNDNVFAWVDTAAMSINDTVTAFDKKMNDALDSIFEGTPLYTPIQQIVGCVVESKLKKIEKAMTWITENVQLEMPELDPKEIISNIASIKAAGANDSFDENIEDFKNEAKQMIKKVLEFYKKQCKLLLYISAIILLIWFFFVLIGLVILFFRERRIRKLNSAEDDSSNPDISENEKEETDLTLVAPFYNESFKTLLYRENSEHSLTRFSKMIQNVKDQYLKARENYVRTPTEVNPKMDQYLDDSIELFTNHGDENFGIKESLNSATTDSNREIEFEDIHLLDSFNSQETAHTAYNNNNAENLNYTHNNYHYPNRDTYNEGTLSVIGENLVSMNKARCWTP